MRKKNFGLRWSRMVLRGIPVVLFLKKLKFSGVFIFKFSFQIIKSIQQNILRLVLMRPKKLDNKIS